MNISSIRARTWSALFDAMILELKTLWAFNEYLCKKTRKEKRKKQDCLDYAEGVFVMSRVLLQNILP